LLDSWYFDSLGHSTATENFCPSWVIQEYHTSCKDWGVVITEKVKKVFRLHSAEKTMHKLNRVKLLKVFPRNKPVISRFLKPERIYIFSFTVLDC